MIFVAYGLFFLLPISGRISGDPIADSFAVCCRSNNGLLGAVRRIVTKPIGIGVKINCSFICHPILIPLVVADGVNWGEQSRMAARWAVHGAVNHVNSTLFSHGQVTADTYIGGIRRRNIMYNLNLQSMFGFYMDGVKMGQIANPRHLLIIA